MTRKRILSGVQPSGKLHLGNYFGAVKQHIAVQDEGECFYFIADFHSLTTIRDTTDKLNENLGKPIPARQYQSDFIRDVALDYLALGLDPDKVAFFRQSDVPEVTELAWILSTVTSMGLLERAVSYKEKVQKGIGRSGSEPVDSTEQFSDEETIDEANEASVGLFFYPVLMAADILIYRSHSVPVGKDQIQHVEMTRKMAARFNRAYGEVFPIPDYCLDVGAKVPGIDGQKMSKSYGNTIEIFAEGNKLKKRVMSIVTDSRAVEDVKDPTTCNVFALYSLFATPEEQTALAELYRAGGMGYGVAKQALLEKINEYFAAARQKRKELANNLDYVEEVLVKGARKARAEARKTMELVRTAVGLKPAPLG